MKPLLLGFVLLAGCCTTRESVTTRPDTLHVPYALDTVLVFVPGDTAWVAYVDERVTVRVDTLMKKVYLRIRDTVTVTRIDTVAQTVVEKVDPSAWWVFWHSVEYWLSTFVLGGLLAAVGVLYLIKKFKK